MKKIGFGGGCHWCTEAVFQALLGVAKVEQGWISSIGENDYFSEAVIVHFDENKIDLTTLVAIHLYTHSCTSVHLMRKKYRSAVYTYTAIQAVNVQKAIRQLQVEFEQPIITEVLAYHAFKENDEQYQNYYQKHKEKPFCQTYINPKLSLLRRKFSKHVDPTNKHI